MIDFIIMLITTIAIAYLIDFSLKLWYSIPIKEEKQTPFYIIKNL